MKILLEDNGLIIAPESDFEEQYLGQFHGCDFKTFLKHGTTAEDLVGLKIEVIPKV